jgi:hypothetical protein
MKMTLSIPKMTSKEIKEIKGIIASSISVIFTNTNIGID